MKKKLVHWLAGSSLPAYLRSLRSRDNSVSIFTYHAVIDQPLPFPDWCFIDAEDFRSQVAYLSQHADIISMSEAVDLLERNAVQGPKAVITFDDGYSNIHDVALPILQEFSAPAIIYLTTDLIDTDQRMWFTSIIRALALSTRTRFSWDSQTICIATSGQKMEACQLLQQRLKALPPATLLSLVAEIEQRLGVAPEPATPRDSPFHMLDQTAIESLLQTGLIEFGAHTASHAILSHLDRGQKLQEIQTSLQRVQRFTGQPCLHFAYPNGRAVDFDEECKLLLSECGVRSAVTMIPDAVSAPLLDRYSICRYPVGADTTLARFKLMANHFC